MKRLFFVGVLMVSGVYSAGGMAACPTVVGPNPWVITPPSPQNYSGPVDGVPHGEQIGSGFSQESQVVTYFSTCNHAQLVVNAAPAKSPISGITYNDGTTDYEVYDTGVSGIGYAVGIKDPQATNYVPLTYPQVQTYPAPGTGSVGQNVGISVKVVFVATGHLSSGTYNIASQNIAILSSTQTDGQTNQGSLNISGVTVNVTSTGCNVTSSNNATINLGDILPSAFTGVGSLAGSGSTTLSLQCDSGVQLWASMSDSSDPANTTQTLSLTPDSVAEGVGIQFFANGSPTPVTFGPDSSSKGLPYSFFIDNSTGDGSVIEFPIVAKYIQTGRLAPGSANGVATVTFSYQ